MPTIDLEEKPQATTGLITTGKQTKPKRILIYGTGGVGKSTLASMAPEPVFIDLESGTFDIDLTRIDADGWQYEQLRSTLESDVFQPYATLVIDTATKLEDMLGDYVCRTIPTKSGKRANSLEDYGYGAGWNYVYDAYLAFLSLLDKHVRAGRHVILIAHEFISKAVNPHGEDFPRFEPRLYSSGSGKASIRYRTKEWCDEVWFVHYDMDVRQGKGKGSASRRIYTREMPTHLAKTRKLTEDYSYTLEQNPIFKEIF